MLFYGFGIVLISAGVALFGYEALLWQRTGEWAGYSLLWAVSHIAGLQAWVYHPEEWIGVHKTLDVMPTYLTCIVLGVLYINWDEP